MKIASSLQRYSLFLVITLLALPVPSSALPKKAKKNLFSIELCHLIENADEYYVYCDKDHSHMPEAVAQLSELDHDKNSPLCKLNEHIKQGFSISKEADVVDALMHAEKIINKSTANNDAINQASAMINSIIDAIVNGQLIVNTAKELANSDVDANEAVLSRSNPLEDENDQERSSTLKIKKDTRFYKHVTFKHKVQFNEFSSFHGNAHFRKDVEIFGTLSAGESIASCDLTVGCNINLNDSESSSVGNIFKEGDSFVHNYGEENTFIGLNAGNFSMTGGGNSGMGAFTLEDNETGSFNSGSGLAALADNLTGDVNTANGALALVSNQSGSANTAAGCFAMVSNVIGSANTAFGLAALASNNDGFANTAVGIRALRAKTTGSRNIGIGADAGISLTTGDDNIYIAADGASSESGFIRIGTYLTQIETYIQGIFGSSVSVGGLAVEVDSTGKLGTTVSSSRFKKDIAGMDMDSAKIYDLNPVSFSYKNDKDEAKHYGLIAEEVAQVFPSLVVNDAEGNPFAVRYQVLPVLLLNEVQKQHASIVALAERVAHLEERA